MKKFALLSVTDKSGIVPFAKSLLELGYEILSTGGTATHLAENKVSFTSVSDYTGQKEIMDGRVKTLHPKIHGGILARRKLDQDLSELSALDAGLIEVVCVNLYPFVKVLKDQTKKSEAEMIEFIDIGGPTLLRAAAKNFNDVYSVIDPQDYDAVIDNIRSAKSDLNFRRKLSAKVFAHIAAYDLKIAGYLSSLEDSADQNMPRYLGEVQELVQGLRYGENPDQKAGWYASLNRADTRASSSLTQVQGKELSYNNVNDIYAASDLMLDLREVFNEEESVVIIKHANPCGVALGESVLDAFQSALACDPISAFGGIIACSCEVSEDLAGEFVKSFYEVIIAPSFTHSALSVLESKKNLRVVSIDYARLLDARKANLQFKTVIEGNLIQAHDNGIPSLDNITWAVGDRFTNASQAKDALLAGIVCKHVKSNAIVITKNKQAIGIGAGQMNRVDSSRIAISRAKNHGFEVAGAVVASDAFLPFSDNIEVFSEAGIILVVQPGGSIRDQEVIDSAKERGINMVFTGRRHFRH